MKLLKEPKIIVKGGWVLSKNDIDKHYIHENALCNLYGINKRVTKGDTVGVNYNWIELSPRQDGNYNLAKEISDQIESRWIPIAKSNWVRDMDNLFKEKIQKLSFIKKLKMILYLLNIRREQ